MSRLSANVASADGARIVSLTNSSGGTASNTIADVPAAYDEAVLAVQISSLAAKINEIIVILRNAGAVV